MTIFWLLRHTLYIAVSAYLLMVEPMASDPIVLAAIAAVITIAHVWKCTAYFIRDTMSQRRAAPIAPKKELPTPQFALIDATLALGDGCSSGLGLGAASSSPHTAPAVVVVAVAARSAGEQAGVRRGDRIVQVGGEPCGTSVAMVQLAMRASRTLELRIARAVQTGASQLSSDVSIARAATPSASELGSSPPPSPPSAQKPKAPYVV